MTSVSTIVANIWHVDAPARGIWRRMAQTKRSALALLRTNLLRTLSLRARMGILVIAGVVPLLLLDLGVVYTDYLSDREHAGDQALNLARRVAVSVESELRMRIGILEVLTMSRALAAGDLVTFRSEVEAVIARQSPGANIVLLREDGQQLMNTALPSGLPLPKRQNLENQQRVFATGRPSVSDIYVGVVVGKPVVAIDVPVLRADGSVRLILALNPTFDALSSLIVSPTPNEDWIITPLTGWADALRETRALRALQRKWYSPISSNPGQRIEKVYWRRPLRRAGLCW